MNAWSCLALTLVLASCTDELRNDSAARQEPRVSPVVAGATTTLGTGFSPAQGPGVLAAQEQPVPDDAPPWARVGVEVLERQGQRWLAATGRASKIANVALARATAENRARALLAQWTKSERQVGAQLREVWRSDKDGDTFARVELPVPANWTPGAPLASP